LDRENGWQRTYRKAYRRYAGRLPQVIVRQFPIPDDNRSRRMCVLSLLSSMSSRDTNTARLAEPTIARAMADENPALRQIAVGSYEGQVLRTQINPGLKKARVTEFLRLAEDDDHWVRGNAAVALYYFPDEAARVAPVLVKILPEPHPHLQLTIARSLAHVDREAAIKAGVAAIAAGHLKDPEKGFKDPTLQHWNGWEIARQAADVLGELHAEPTVSVPALIEGLGSTNREVAIAAFRALTKFKEQADQTLPALRRAAVERNDIPNWVKAELEQIDREAAKP
jgi:HEAT repeat protein